MTDRLEPISEAHPAPAAPVRPILLTPAERDAERRRRERARAARRDAREEAEGGADAPAGDAPAGAQPRIDVRG